MVSLGSSDIFGPPDAQSGSRKGGAALRPRPGSGLSGDAKAARRCRFWLLSRMGRPVLNDVVVLVPGYGIGLVWFGLENGLAICFEAFSARSRIGWPGAAAPEKVGLVVR